MKNKIEILSPGGDPDAVKAAIIAGADAVYLGLKKFNARKRAANITPEILKDLLNIAHGHKVKIFVTMNILLTEKEIPEAVEAAAELIALGVDAIIVQDAGFALLLNKLFPDLEVHASTQMTTHNSLQTALLKKFGIKQVNFSRELSATELKPLITDAHHKNIKTEIFVHGAYCISCSGICYMSAYISAQPGNRGQCLQPCRRQYSTEEDSDKKYLLSLKDNSAINHADELIELGADTLKIEGRIKNYSYVYQVTDAWRKQIDAVQNFGAGNNLLEENVKKVFNRGFSAGYFESHISSKMFVDSPLDQSQKLIGNVEFYHADSKQLTLEKNRSLPIGARINIYTSENSFVCGAVVNGKVSGNCFKIEIENQLKGKIQKGQVVLLLNEPANAAGIKESIDSLSAARHKLDVTVRGKAGEQLFAEFYYENKSYRVLSHALLQKAEKSGLDEKSIRGQFGRLGDTYFELENINLENLDPGLFIPVKELNKMRREAIDSFSTPKPNFSLPVKNQPRKNNIKKIALLVSDNKAAQAFLENFDGPVFIETGSATKADQFDKNIFPWLPAFITDEEIPFYQKLIHKVNPELIVSDNSGLGNWCGAEGINWIAGPQLNASNSYSFDAFKNLAGALGGFYSGEINKEQINDINTPDGFLTFFNVYGPILLMTTRQCLFQKPGLCIQGKAETDKGCKNGCVNYTEYFDERNVPFHILKSAGELIRIFNDAMLFLPEAVLQTNADYYLLDFRSFPFIRQDIFVQKKILDYFQKIIFKNKTDDSSEKKLKQLIGNVTRGNFKRGFE